MVTDLGTAPSSTQKELGKKWMASGGKASGNVYGSAKPNTQSELKKTRACKGGGGWKRSAGIPHEGMPKQGVPIAR